VNENIDKILVFTLEFFDAILPIIARFIAETSGRVKCPAGKQFPAPGTTLQVPMPGPREKKECKCPGVARGGMGNARID
jgi:hypothetical protein